MCFKNLKNTSQRYGTVAQFFHWLIFILFVGMFVAAEIMMDMPPSPDKYQLYGWHKSVGVVLLLLAFLRLSWKMANPHPVHLNTGLQKRATQAVHFGLYVAMFAMPISGYVMSMAGGHSVVVFNVLTLPNLVGLNKPLAGFAHQVHEVTAYAIYGLAALHVAAALFQHFVQKNNTLRRMLPKMK